MVLDDPALMQSDDAGDADAMTVDGCPIVGYLDAPARGSAVSGFLEVSGWAFSRVGTITMIQVVVDDAPVRTLQPGVSRPDVRTLFPDVPRGDCGYYDRISIGLDTRGPLRVIVRVSDDCGNVRDFVRSVLSTPVVATIHIDSPHPGENSAGGVIVSGWAFSARAPIIRVEALLGDRLLGLLTHGLPRPDIYALFREPTAATSGFWGSFEFPVTHIGRETLRVRAVTAVGEAIDADVTLRVTEMPEPATEIEHAAWRGDCLEVAGWSFLPGHTPPLIARVFVDGGFVTQTRVHLSRPDIRQRFLMNPVAARSGFRIRQPLLSPHATSPAFHVLTIEFVDSAGRRTTRELHVSHDDHGVLDQTTGVSSPLGEAITAFEERVGRAPVILDWETGLSLASAFPTCAIFSPPVPASSAAMPYLDQSIDVVVTPIDDAARVGHARRIAGAAILTMIGTHGTGTPTTEHRPADRHALCTNVEWRWHSAPEGLYPPPLPSCSVVIPVHNQATYTRACLTQLMATLPHSFNGEIIVVDDGSSDDTADVLAQWGALDVRVRTIRNAENVGFIASCNRGAQEAGGDVLLFLNNDTLPRPGWLPPLLRLLRDRPDVGAVGAKLLFPDGSLQEAGGIIYADGTGCNFGKFDPHPAAPLYDHLREVDYCSGAALATRRALFEAAGGFDTRFAPAYYEDVDYCFTLRTMGYATYYQPESEVIHIEGATSGTDLSVGTKSYQVRNRQTFVEKWGKQLRGHAPPPDDARLTTLYALATRGGARRTGR